MEASSASVALPLTLAGWASTYSQSFTALGCPFLAVEPRSRQLISNFVKRQPKRPWGAYAAAQLSQPNAPFIWRLQFSSRSSNSSLPGYHPLEPPWRWHYSNIMAYSSTTDEPIPVTEVRSVGWINPTNVLQYQGGWRQTSRPRATVWTASGTHWW